jgi:hypothetical protein
MKKTELSFTETQVTTLRKALESYISDLRMEIADTEQEDFKEGLKKEKEVLNGILEALKQ